MMEYYDLVLGLIPMSLVGVSWFLHAIGFGLTTAIPLAAAIAAALIAHALFVRAPVSPPSSTDRRPPGATN